MSKKRSPRARALWGLAALASAGCLAGGLWLAGRVDGLGGIVIGGISTWFLAGVIIGVARAAGRYVRR